MMTMVGGPTATAAHLTRLSASKWAAVVVGPPTMVIIKDKNGDTRPPLYSQHYNPINCNKFNIYTKEIG